MEKAVQFSGRLTDLDFPFVLHGVLSWPQTKWTLQDWEDALKVDNQKYPCRKGHYRCSVEPQWERSCSTEHLTVEQLFARLKSDLAEEEEERDTDWLYFDYKHLFEWFSDNDSLKDICWDAVGFPDRTGRDSTIWIGTRGSHTPCHFDTYGCNFVAQLYGRKKWILFPPTEIDSLEPTRVPYEESSVYSQINFACGCNSMKNLKEARTVVLEPGDVLYVPKGWWHYVENVTPAISVNTWCPLESDDRSRLEESLVKCFVTSISKEMTDEDKLELLNPNEDGLGSRVDFEEVCWCLGKLKEGEGGGGGGGGGAADVQVDIHPVPSLPLATLRPSLRRKCKLSHNNYDDDDGRTGKGERGAKRGGVGVKEVLNAFCHPEVVALVRTKLQTLSDTKEK